jgi:hypothetical protein
LPWCLFASGSLASGTLGAGTRVDCILNLPQARARFFFGFL